jgi:hypothetical protein
VLVALPFHPLLARVQRVRKRTTLFQKRKSCRREAGVRCRRVAAMRAALADALRHA